MAQIAAGAQEEATALQEVNTAVGQMDKMTQQNAAMAEQASAASQTLSAEGEKLSSLIAAFSVGDRTSPGALRAALKEAAPHAFKDTPARRPSASEPRSRRRSAGLRAEGSAAMAAEPKEVWKEF